MKHTDIIKDLVFYLDDELSPEKKMQVENHLKECADCSSFLAFLQEGMQVIEKEKKPQVSPFFYTRLSARLEERKDLELSSWWVRVAQPAFFTLMLGIGIVGGLKLGSNASYNQAKQSPATILLINDFEVEPIESFLLDKI